MRQVPGVTREIYNNFQNWPGEEGIKIFYERSGRVSWTASPYFLPRDEHVDIFF